MKRKPDYLKDEGLDWIVVDYFRETMSGLTSAHYTRAQPLRGVMWVSKLMS